MVSSKLYVEINDNDDLFWFFIHWLIFFLNRKNFAIFRIDLIKSSFPLIVIDRHNEILLCVWLIDPKKTTLVRISWSLAFAFLFDSSERETVNGRRNLPAGMTHSFLDFRWTRHGNSLIFRSPGTLLMIKNTHFHSNTFFFSDNLRNPWMGAEHSGFLYKETITRLLFISSDPFSYFSMDQQLFFSISIPPNCFILHFLVTSGLNRQGLRSVWMKLRLSWFLLGFSIQTTHSMLFNLNKVRSIAYRYSGNWIMLEKIDNLLNTLN